MIGTSILPHQRINARIFMHLAALLLMTVSFIFFHETVERLVHKWLNSGTYAHGMVIPFISLGLIFTRLPVLKHIAFRSSWWGVAALAIAVTFWMLGVITHTVSVQQFAFVALFPSIILAVYGWEIVRAIRFPLLYLFFCVPFGNFLVETLQDFTATMTLLGLKLSGISFYNEGWVIVTTRGTFEVAKACSGIRYLIAAIVLGLVYAYLGFHTLRNRVLFMSMCAIVPIVANGIRAYFIVLLAYSTHLRLAIGVDHFIYGWVFFAFVMGCLFALGEWLKRREPTQQIVKPSHCASTTTMPSLGVCSMAFFVLLTPFIVIQNSKLTSFTPTLIIPPGFEQSELSMQSWFPINQRANKTILLQRDIGDKKLDLAIAMYTNQSQGNEMVDENNHFFTREWAQAAAQVITLAMNSKQVKINEYEVFQGEQRRLVWQWYQVGSRQTASGIIAKILELGFRLRNQQVISACVVASIPYDFNKEDAQISLKENYVGTLQFYGGNHAT